MNGIRVTMKAPQGGTVQVLILRHVTDAHNIASTMQRKPVISAIIRALIAGGRVEIEPLT